METLTLAYLAPYLPYGLKGIFTHLPGGRQFELTSIIINKDNDEYDDNVDVSGSCGRFGGETADISNFKPILRPMSDFDEPLDRESEFYSYLSKCRKECCFQNRVDVDRDLDFNIEDSDSNYFNLSEALKLYNFLIENHFDVFGLIEKGLAISIHDVKEVPNV